MAWGCFCRIPCPYRGWEEDNRYAMLNMFPLIGTALGVLAGVIWWLLSLLGVSSLLTGALLTFSYFWMTGLWTAAMRCFPAGRWLTGSGS